MSLNISNSPPWPGCDAYGLSDTCLDIYNYENLCELLQKITYQAHIYYTPPNEVQCLQMNTPMC